MAVGSGRGGGAMRLVSDARLGQRGVAEAGSVARMVLGIGGSWR